MIDELINRIIKQVQESFPQLECPCAMKAEIVSAKETEDVYKRNIFLTNTETKERKEYELEQKYYVYSIRVLNNSGERLEGYPIFPNIRCGEKFEVGSQVTIVFIGGELSPVIVGG